MIIVRREDAVHKAWLFRLLTEIADNPVLSRALHFKGGTAASCLGFLDRFSVDLDFDQKPGIDEKKLRLEFNRIFKKLGLKIDSENQKTLSFVLKYESAPGMRNTMKLDALNLIVKANKYQIQYLPEIGRYLSCQNVETMFANKLVAIFDRYAKHKSIAGRDLYDIHHFFLKGYQYERAVIKERMNLALPDFFNKLILFVEKHYTEKIINEDLNTLLPADKFQQIRRILKQESLMFLKNEAPNFGKPVSVYVMSG